MTVSELIEQLKGFQQDTHIHCQVVGQESGAWNMAFEFWERGDMVGITVDHPQLKTLPMSDECNAEDKLRKIRGILG